MKKAITELSKQKRKLTMVMFAVIALATLYLEPFLPHKGIGGTIVYAGGGPYPLVKVAGDKVHFMIYVHSTSNVVVDFTIMVWYREHLTDGEGEWLLASSTTPGHYLNPDQTEIASDVHPSWYLPPFTTTNDMIDKTYDAKIELWAALPDKLCASVIQEEAWHVVAVQVAGEITYWEIT